VGSDYIDTLEELAMAVDNYLYYTGRVQKKALLDKIKALSEKISRYQTEELARVKR